MQNHSCRRIKRILSGTMAALFLAAMLFSSFFIAVEADHDCTGEDCPICAVVHQCENTLRSVSGGPAVPAIVIPLVLSCLLAAFLYKPYLVQETPVSEKVRMDN